MKPTHVVIALVLTLTGDAARGDIATLVALKDNTLIESPSGGRSNGSGTHVFTGRTSQSSNSIRRAVLAFDPALAIPHRSVVTSASLTLHCSRANAGSEAITVHRLRADWGQGASSASGGQGAPAARGDATWIHTFFSSEFWMLPGGDFEPVPSSGAVVEQPGFYTWGSSPRLVADVLEWLDFPQTNHGWILIGGETAPSTSKRFDSSENTDPSLRPYLTVEFDPDPSADDRSSSDDSSDD